MLSAVSMPKVQLDKHENDDQLLMSAVSMAMESTLYAEHAFAITRLGNSAVLILPKSTLPYKFIFSMFYIVLHEYFLCGIRWVLNKISWKGFTQSPQPTEHNSSREGP